MSTKGLWTPTLSQRLNIDSRHTPQPDQEAPMPSLTRREFARLSALGAGALIGGKRYQTQPRMAENSRSYSFTSQKVMRRKP